MTVQISSQTLRQAGNQLNQVGSRLDGELTKVENDLLALGEPWGKDQIGQLIEVAYQAVVTVAFECLRGVLHDILQSGQDLVDQAGHWENQEQSISDGFTNVLGELGSR